MQVSNFTDGNPDDAYQRLSHHLQALATIPGTSVDQRLIQEYSIFYAPAIDDKSSRRGLIINQLSEALLRLQDQDPSPLVDLLSKLTGPLSFRQILSLESPVSLETLLDPSAEKYNLLGLGFLEKAAESHCDIANLASRPSVVMALVTLWLTTVDAGVATKASKVLDRLLTQDKELSLLTARRIGDDSLSRSRCQTLMWRRLFGDKDIYGFILSYCSLQGHDKTQGGRTQKTVAQARLMELALRIGGLDWSCLSRSHHAALEKNYGLDPTQDGFLDFIVSHMVESNDDFLMHMSLLHFFADLISNVKERSRQNRDVSISLEYLQARGLHDRTIAVWLNSGEPARHSLDRTALFGPAAKYVSSFASNYPCSFLKSALVRPLLLHLFKSLSISSGHWAQSSNKVPVYDLNIIHSLPRIALLPQTQIGVTPYASPLLLIPVRNTTPEALYTLSKVFQGPAKPQSEDYSIIPDVEASPEQPEAAAARAAYFMYLSSFTHGSEMYAYLVGHADTTALIDTALAAMQLIESVTTANWAPLPSESPSNQEDRYDPAHAPRRPTALPTETQFCSLLPWQCNVGKPQTGVAALLQPEARPKLFPWLLAPPRFFSSHRRGRGDDDDPEYKVASRKWQLLQAFHRRLKEAMRTGEVDAQEERKLLEALEVRLREGFWGSGTSSTGREVATLES